MEYGYNIPDLNGKGVPIHYMKAHWGTEDIAPWHYPGDNGKRHALAALLLGEGLFPSLHVSSGRLADPESQSRNFGEKINHLPLSGTRTTHCPGRSLSLHRLSRRPPTSVTGACRQCT